MQKNEKELYMGPQVARFLTGYLLEVLPKDTSNLIRAMALAWASRQEKNPAMDALLGVETSSQPAAPSAGREPKERRGRTLLGVSENLKVRIPPNGLFNRENNDKPLEFGDDLPEGYCLVFTLVLPDGLGDLIFGENAVQELLDVAPIAWVRCHVSDEQLRPGEELIAATAARLSFNLASAGKSSLAEKISPQRLERLWVNAKDRFLAPWIFGLSENDQVSSVDVKACEA
eukprot:s1561_g9.t1